jgi:hypothetical protein
LNRGNGNEGLNPIVGENRRIHNYWQLSYMDAKDLYSKIHKYQKELYMFQEDEVMVDLIRTIHPMLIQWNEWIKEMPVFSSLMKDREYFHLFDKPAIHMLDNYLVFSAMYEYINAASERVILQKERETSKQKRRATIAEKEDPFQPGQLEEERDDDLEDVYRDLEEAEIMMNDGEQEELNTRVGKLLMVFVNMYQKNKEESDYSYADIERNMNKERTKEKERIMKRFTMNENGEKKTEEERNIEYMKKNLGLGIWNVGKQKSIFQYDKATSDWERQQMMEQGISELAENLVDNEIGETAEY